MAPLGDLLDEIRLVASQPPEYEERPPHTKGVHSVQETSHQEGRSPSQPIPLSGRDQLLECGGMKVLLDVNGEVVGYYSRHLTILIQPQRVRLDR